MKLKIAFTVLLAIVATVDLRAQCSFSCPTADDADVQATLDATALVGGGTVQLEPRVYNLCSARVVGSNTHLRGAGRGATIVRAVTGYAGRIVSNTWYGSLVGSVGSNNVTISDLTVDTFTCNIHTNAVSLLPAGTAVGLHDGAVVTNGLVENVEVQAAPGYHAYQIWNLKGEHIKFINNWIDGHSTVAATCGADQEGLESYGGRDVLMSGNTVKNIGQACITLGAGDIVDSDTEGLRIVNNHLSGCTIGIKLTASGVYGGESTAATLIHGNDITNSRLAGIYVPLDLGAFVRALNITQNAIIGVSSPLASGIRLSSNGTASQIPSEQVVGTTVAYNHVEGVTGTNSFGIYVSNYPNARLLYNTVIGSIGAGSDGIRSANSTGIEIVGNRVQTANATAIGVYRTGTLTSARVIIEGNRISDWLGTSSGIFVSGLTYGTAKDNVFSRSDTATPSPVWFANSCGVTISGNVPWYLPSYTQLTTPACP